ncbi:MAG: hypothetical protein ACHQAX_03410 [Gammaproteobacteria bacterium]
MSMSSPKKIRAVTLFEMLLVLFVSSLIAVSTFKYQQQQSQAAVADPLAQKMYLYAQTVRQFVVDNQAGIATGTFNPFALPAIIPTTSTFKASGTGATTTYTLTGVSWLQNLYPPGSQTPYLPKVFTFAGLNPLELRRGDLTGDAAIQVQITTTKVTIVYGALYDLSADGKLEGSVTAMAAVKANKLYDPLLGISSFHYVGGVDKTGAVMPITATWDKTQTQETHITSPDVTGNLNVSGALNLSPGVPPGGGAPISPDITGVGTLSFDPAGVGAVNNVNALNFSANGQINNLTAANMTNGGAINGIGALNFGNGTSGSVAPSAIAGVQSITFASAQGANITFPSSGGEIKGLSTLTFNTAGAIANLDNMTFSGTGVINGVQQINFAGGAFTGITNVVVINQTMDGRDESQQPAFPTGVTNDKGVCFLSVMQANWCKIIQVSGGAGNQYMLKGKSGTCEATCFVYNTNAGKNVVQTP